MERKLNLQRINNWFIHILVVKRLFDDLKTLSKLIKGEYDEILKIHYLFLVSLYILIVQIMENQNLHSVRTLFHIFFTQRSYLENKIEKIRIHKHKKQKWFKPSLMNSKSRNITYVTVTKHQRDRNKINIRCCYFKRDDRHLQSKLLADRVSSLVVF